MKYKYSKICKVTVWQNNSNRQMLVTIPKGFASRGDKVMLIKESDILNKEVVLIKGNTDRSANDSASSRSQSFSL